MNSIVQINISESLKNNCTGQILFRSDEQRLLERREGLLLTPDLRFMQTWKDRGVDLLQ